MIYRYGICSKFGCMEDCCHKEIHKLLYSSCNLSICKKVNTICGCMVVSPIYGQCDNLPTNDLKGKSEKLKGVWCNGSTSDFGSGGEGSNPSTPLDRRSTE